MMPLPHDPVPWLFTDLPLSFQAFDDSLASYTGVEDCQELWNSGRLVCTHWHGADHLHLAGTSTLACHLVLSLLQLDLAAHVRVRHLGQSVLQTGSFSLQLHMCSRKTVDKMHGLVQPGSMEGQLGALRRVCFGELGFVEQLDALDDEKKLL